MDKKKGKKKDEEKHNISSENASGSVTGHHQIKYVPLACSAEC